VVREHRLVHVSVTNCSLHILHIDGHALTINHAIEAIVVLTAQGNNLIIGEDTRHVTLEGRLRGQIHDTTTRNAEVTSSSSGDVNGEDLTSLSTDDTIDEGGSTGGDEGVHIEQPF